MEETKPGLRRVCSARSNRVCWGAATLPLRRSKECCASGLDNSAIEAEEGTHVKIGRYKKAQQDQVEFAI
jgi:hypothetical protein